MSRRASRRSPPFWEVRRRHAGTMDDVWLAERHPLSPEDFDFRFWQSATPDCVTERWLSGSEIVTLTNLHREHPLMRVALPGVELKVTLVRRGRPDEVAPAVLDGVHFDFRDGSDAVALTWRASFPWPDGVGDVHLKGGARG